MANLSSLSGSLPDVYCQSLLSSWIMISQNIVRSALLLPASCLILHRSLQQWRRRGSLSKESYSDVMAYNVCCLELIRGIGFMLQFCSFLIGWPVVLGAVQFIYWVTFFGENNFHVLTCLERYLAVVFPHTYLRLRGEGGVRIRSASLGASWLLPLVLGNINHFLHDDLLSVLLSFSTLIFSSLTVSFCSLSVLCILFQPRPGRHRGQVDPTRRRAVHTIMAVWAVLLLWLLGLLLSYGLHFSAALSPAVSCQVVAWSYWSGLPSSLLLPLLYLQRAGLLSRCCGGRS